MILEDDVGQPKGPDDDDKRRVPASDGFDRMPFHEAAMRAASADGQLSGEVALRRFAILMGKSPDQPTT
jgi:hypothetical protein